MIGCKLNYAGTSSHIDAKQVCRSIPQRGCAESKLIVARVFILLQHACPGVVETAPKAQAKTTWWHNVVDHWIDVLVSPESTGGHAHLVL